MYFEIYTIYTLQSLHKSIEKRLTSLRKPGMLMFGMLGMRLDCVDDCSAAFPPPKLNQFPGVFAELPDIMGSLPNQNENENKDRK